MEIITETRKSPLYKVVSAWGWETNPFANSATSNDGGGYPQPYSGYLLETDHGIVVVEVDDKSCGNFGTRIYVDVDAIDVGMRWYVNIGDMDDASIYPEEVVEDISDSIWGVLGLELWDLIALGREVADVCC